MSIRAKLGLLIAVCVTVPLVASALFWINTLHETVDDVGWDVLLASPAALDATLSERALKTASTRSATTAEVLELIGKRLVRDLAVLGEELEARGCLRARGPRPTGCDQPLRELLAVNPDLDGVLVLSPSEPLREVRGELAADRIEAGAAAAAAVPVGAPPLVLEPMRAGNGWVLVTTRPIEGVPGSRVSAWGPFADMRRRLDDAISGRAMRIGLVTGDGQLLSPLRFRPRQAEPRVVGKLDLDVDGRRLAPAEWQRAGKPHLVAIAGHRYVLAHAAVKGASLGVVALSDFDQLTTARLVAAVHRHTVLALVLIGVALAAAVALAGPMTRRLRDLTRAADEFGAGHLDTPVPVGGADEVGRLAARFRAMAAQLREQIETLEQKVDERTRDLRLQAEELARINEDMVRLTKLKSDFFARVTHELRTPLTAIIGFSELLRAGGCGPVTDAQRDALEKVWRSGTNLLQLINDILDLSKIEADRLSLRFARVELPVVVDVAVSTSALRAAQKGIALTTDLAPDVPVLRTDEARLLQILNNLLSNAVKFTDRGGVTIGARMVDAERVALTVRDTGIGIEAKDLGYLFTEFYQTDASQARRQEGTGLGLAITRRLAEALGGGVTVESAPGVGTTFTVTLPVVAPGADEALEEQDTLATAAAPPAQRRAEPTILVVDDDPSTQHLVSEHLKVIGARFLSASTGEDGLRIAALARPDLIMLDIRLPDRHGSEVLHDLKANPATAGIPVIVISVVDKESLGFSLGAVDYLVKPINWDHLFDVLARLGIGPGRGDVLVVDDEPTTRDLVRRVLAARGFAVREAGNGEAALAAVRERAPGLMVLDLMMPVMDGFDTLAALRADPATATLPVVVLTGKHLTDEERAKLTGKVHALFEKDRVPLEGLVAEVSHVLRQGMDAGAPR